jgi:hypothetical protein
MPRLLQRRQSGSPNTAKYAKIIRLQPETIDVFQDPQLTTEMEMRDDGGVPHTKFKEPFCRYRFGVQTPIRYPKSEREISEINHCAALLRSSHSEAPIHMLS